MILAAAAGPLNALRPRPVRVPAGGPAAVEARVRDLDIQFFEERARRDSMGARDRMQLGVLHLQRARSTGSFGDLLLAEERARESLRRRNARNAAAYVVLASALMGQHRFGEAREAAIQLVEQNPDRASYRALLGEVELELGNYGSANSLFGALSRNGDALALGPRLARWAEIRGRPVEARRLLLGALTAATRRKEMPTEQLAWLRLRLGDLAFRNGNGGESEAHYRAGLVAAPDDHRILAALARLEFSRGRNARALEWAERAVAVVLEPSTLALLTEIHAARGDSAAAMEHLRSFELAVGGQATRFHRDWTLFLLEHGRDVNASLARAAEDLKERRDIYGYDVLAWALHRSGRSTEAAEPMRRALALGTRDALLQFHAGMIMRATGDTSGARRHLAAAVMINPIFSPSGAAAARATLDSIQAGR